MYDQSTSSTAIFAPWKQNMSSSPAGATGMSRGEGRRWKVCSMKQTALQCLETPQLPPCDTTL